MRDNVHALPAADGVPLITPLAAADRAGSRGTAVLTRGSEADQALRELQQQTRDRGPAGPAADGAAGETSVPEDADRGVARRRPGPGARLLTVVAALAALAAVAVALYAVLAHPAGPLEHSVTLPGRLGSLPAWVTVAAVLAALMTAAISLRGLLRAVQDTAIEDVLTVVVAAMVTAVCLNGMWRFFGNVLHFPPALRVLVFGVLEGGTIVCALRAKRTIRRHIARINAGEISPNKPASVGADGLMMWAFTSLSAVLASLGAGSFPAAVARFAMPLLAAWLWDRSLRLEHQRATGRTINWAVTPERVLVWLHLAEPASRSTEEVDAHRYITRVAHARHVYRRREACGAAPWRVNHAYQAFERRWQAALDHTALATAVDLQDELFKQCAARDGARALATATQRAPWAGQEQDEEKREKPPPNKRRRRGRSADDAVTFGELAGLLAEARATGDHGQVHDLLAGRGDHAGFTRWLATSGKGTKRLMAVVALYATGAPATYGTPANWAAAARNWVIEQVPGVAGEIDRKDIRTEAAKLAPVWAEAASTAGNDEETSQ
jgi:hypothetical protein